MKRLLRTSSSSAQQQQQQPPPAEHHLHPTTTSRRRPPRTDSSSQHTKRPGMTITTAPATPLVEHLHLPRMLSPLPVRLHLSNLQVLLLVFGGFFVLSNISTSTLVLQYDRSWRDDIAFRGINNDHERSLYKAKKKKLVIDLLSIGSQSRPDYYQTQSQTFATHSAVRQFVALTEADDMERDCVHELTMRHIDQICTHCRNSKRFQALPGKEYSFLKSRASNFFNNATMARFTNPVGWVCAQKRPIGGLYNLLQTYSDTVEGGSDGKDVSSTTAGTTTTSFPDYLVIMDDDTWINMPAFVKTLKQMYPANRPLMVAGCRVSLKSRFKLPYGGWAYILTRPVLQALVQPRTCQNIGTNRTDPEWFFCKQLKRNAIGERDLFVEGMSILDLMKKYTFFRHRWADVASWDAAGYCFHSDWLPAYFIQYFDLAEHTPTDDPQHLSHIDHDRLLAYKGNSIRYPDKLRGQTGECLYDSDATCTANSHLCHYVSPRHMKTLFDEQRNNTTME